MTRFIRTGCLHNIKTGENRQAFQKLRENFRVFFRAGAGVYTDLSPEVLKRAMKAFKKRLKLTALDEDSRLGKGAFSGGPQGVCAIQPPNQCGPNCADRANYEISAMACMSCRKDRSDIKVQISKSRNT